MLFRYSIRCAISPYDAIPGGRAATHLHVRELAVRLRSIESRIEFRGACWNLHAFINSLQESSTKATRLPWRFQLAAALFSPRAVVMVIELQLDFKAALTQVFILPRRSRKCLSDVYRALLPWNFFLDDKGQLSRGGNAAEREQRR